MSARFRLHTSDPFGGFGARITVRFDDAGCRLTLKPAELPPLDLGVDRSLELLIALEAAGEIPVTAHEDEPSGWGMLDASTTVVSFASPDSKWSFEQTCPAERRRGPRLQHILRALRIAVADTAHEPVITDWDASLLLDDLPPV